MTRRIAIAVLVLSFSALAQDQDHANMNHADCPMMAQHAGEHSHADMNARGDKAMGFSQENTTHHFRLYADGGAIEVTANGNSDSATLAQVREHLQHIAAAFAQGDFSIPHQVHAETPSGAATMQEMADRLSYRYESLQNGGRVRITTQDPKALAAVHQFLHYQIREHETGDPVELSK